MTFSGLVAAASHLREYVTLAGQTSGFITIRSRRGRVGVDDQETSHTESLHESTALRRMMQS